MTGLKVAQYEIGDLIGFGGMGEVYKAYDSKLDRTVAIKCPRPDTIDSRVAAENLVREARKACKVAHPNLAAIHDVLEHGDRPLLVMEYVEGKNLAASLRSGSLDPDTLLDYVRQITEALAAIHGAGLVHRDLKPSNVVVTEGGHVKVLDFGLAASVIPVQATPANGADTTANFSHALFRRAGTVPYMSPEQLVGATIDQRSDLFALGIMIHEGLTGKHPFQRRSVEGTISSILNDPPGGDSAASRASMTTPLGAVALRLMQKKPEDRYPSAEELARDLREVARGADPQALPGRGVTSRRVVWSGVALAVLIALGLIWSHRPVPETPGRPAVAVLPIEDMTGQEPGRASMVAGLIEAHLSDSADTRAVPAQRVAEIRAGVTGGSLQRMLRKIARGVDTPWLLSGELYFEDAYVGNFDLHNVAAGTSWPFSVTSASAGEVASRAARRVRELIGGEEVEPTVLLAVSESEEAQALYERARQAFHDLDYTRARGLLDRALELDGRFISARILLAEVLHAIGYRALARVEAEEAVILVGAKGVPPESPTALKAEATLARLSNDLRGAAGAYERLLERYPDDVLAATSLALVYRRQGRKEESLALIDRALSYDRLDAQGHLSRADVLVSMRQFEEAEVSIRQAQWILEAFHVPGGAGDVSDSFGTLEFRREDWSAARDFYERAAGEYEAEGLKVSAAFARKSAADVRITLWDLPPAIAAIEEALPLLDAVGHLEYVAKGLGSLGAAFYRTGELERAETVLNLAVSKARELDRIDLEHSALISLSAVLLDSFRTEPARPAILRSLSLARTLGSSWREAHSLLKLGDWYRLRGDAETARATLEPLLAEDSAQRIGRELRLSALQVWTRTATELERPGEALVAADEGVRIAEELEQAGRLSYTLSLRARALARVGNPAAEADLERAEELLAQVTRSPELVGAFQLGRAESLAALADWGQVLALAEAQGPSLFSADLLVLQGRALLELGREQEALAVLGLSDGEFPAGAVARAGWVRARCHESQGEPARARAVAIGAAVLAAETKQSLTHAELSVMLWRFSEDPPDRDRWLKLARESLGEFLELVAPADREQVIGIRVSRGLGQLIDVDGRR